MSRAAFAVALAALCCAALARMELNCGGPAMPGTDWTDASMYAVGKTLRYVVAGPIDAMEYKKVFKSHCFVNEGDLVFRIPVRYNMFKVSLLFAETYQGSGTDFRLFNVAVNDQKLMEPVDVYKRAGEKFNKGIKITFNAMPVNGFITVSLTRIEGKNNPFLSGIIIDYDKTPMDAVAV